MNDSSNRFARVPLNIQDPRINKSGPQANDSYGSFREDHHSDPKYQYQGQDRPNTHMMSIIRRNPDGTLDYEWAKDMVLDALNKVGWEGALLPIDQALLTVVFPDKIQAMEPMQADLMTQFSPSEKDHVRAMVEAQLKEMENWNTGLGGGSVEGRGKTRDGMP